MWLTKQKANSKNISIQFRIKRCSFMSKFACILLLWSRQTQHQWKLGKNEIVYKVVCPWNRSGRFWTNWFWLYFMISLIIGKETVFITLDEWNKLSIWKKEVSGEDSTELFTEINWGFTETLLRFFFHETTS